MCIFLSFGLFMLLCVLPGPAQYIFHTSMARYNLYVLKEPLNTNKQTNCAILSVLRHGWLVTGRVSLPGKILNQHSNLQRFLCIWRNKKETSYNTCKIFCLWDIYYAPWRFIHVWPSTLVVRRILLRRFLGSWFNWGRALGQMDWALCCLKQLPTMKVR